jgi:hypothetical protein
MNIPIGIVLPDALASIGHAVPIREPSDRFTLPLAPENDRQDREPDGQQPEISQKFDVESLRLSFRFEFPESFDRVGLYALRHSFCDRFIYVFARYCR